jgi:hypothetical protein
MIYKKMALQNVDITTTCIPRKNIKNLLKQCGIWNSLHINEEISFFLTFNKNNSMFNNFTMCFVINLH